MTDTNVPYSDLRDPAAVLEALANGLDTLSPEARKAATYVIENPNDVGVSSIREIAEAADVKPNTFVRLARSFGFEGYDEFRVPFREEIRRGNASFPDRARWLQSLSANGQLGALFSDMAESALRNIEETFAATSEAQIKAAADAIVAARKTYVLGVGVHHSNARNFAYLADMAVGKIEAIPRPGNVAVDDLAGAGKGDVLIAMTCKPYRQEIVEAVTIAREQGVTVIGLSDSAASPIVIGSEHGFVVSADTPQFFPSSVSIIALLETLMAFVIADAKPEVIERIDTFHARRHRLGLYVSDDGTRK